MGADMIHTGLRAHMTPIGTFHVEHLSQELESHPELWGQLPLRTHPRSPHREASDIWVRYNAIENLGPAFNEPHDSVWYPCADLIPSVRRFVEEFARQKGAKTIGGILLTRIPPGKQVYWHKDSGWHAQAHRKFIVLLRADHKQTFEFEGEALQADTGDCFEFDNSYAHRVVNNSDNERISLIICLRDFE
jgi:uncharacterized cupin superfamily protein